MQMADRNRIAAQGIDSKSLLRSSICAIVGACQRATE
jgi:hypothetical protein